MDHKDLEYFRKLLSGMLEEAKQKGDSTLEELTDSNEVFADPADRATAESDRAFTLRIRDRERRLIRKIQAALTRIDDGTYGICEDCGDDISVPRLKARPVMRLVRRAEACGRKATLACGEVSPVGMLRPSANWPVPVAVPAVYACAGMRPTVACAKFLGAGLACRCCSGWRPPHCP